MGQIVGIGAMGGDKMTLRGESFVRDGEEGRGKEELISFGRKLSRCRTNSLRFPWD